MKRNKKIMYFLSLFSPLMPALTVAGHVSDAQLRSSLKSSRATQTKRIQLINSDSIFKYSFSARVLQNTELRFYFSDVQSNTIPINTSSGIYSINNYCVKIRDGVVTYPLTANVIDTHLNDSGWAVGPKFWDSSYYTTSYGPDYSYHMADKEIINSNANDYSRIFKENLAATYSGKHDGVYRYRVSQWDHGSTQQNPFNYFLFKEGSNNWKSLADISSSSSYGGALRSSYSFNTTKSFSSLSQFKTSALAPYNPNATTGEFDFGLYDKEIYLAGSQSSINSFSAVSNLYTKYDVDSFYNELNSPSSLAKFFSVGLIDSPKAVISDYKGQKSYIDVTKDDSRQVFTLKLVTANSFSAPSAFSRDQGSGASASYEINETEWMKDASMTKTIELPFSDFTKLVTTELTSAVKSQGISVSGSLSTKLASDVIAAGANTTLYNDLRKWISDNSNAIFVGYSSGTVPEDSIISINRSQVSNSYSSIHVGVVVKDALVNNNPTQQIFEFDIHGFLTLNTDLSTRNVSSDAFSNIPLSEKYIADNRTKIENEIKNLVSQQNINLPPSTTVTIDLSTATYERTSYGVLNDVTINISKHYNSSGQIGGSASFKMNVSGFAMVNPTATFNAFAKYPIRFSQSVKTIDEQTIKNIIISSNSIFTYDAYFPLESSDILNVTYSVNEKTGEVIISFISYRTYNEKGDHNLILENQQANISITGFAPFVPWYEQYFYLLLSVGIATLIIIIILIAVIASRRKKIQQNVYKFASPIPRNRLTGPIPPVGNHAGRLAAPTTTSRAPINHHPKVSVSAQQNKSYKPKQLPKSK